MMDQSIKYSMEALKNKILSDGKLIGKDIIKVDNFLNHRLDVRFLQEIASEFKKRFGEIVPDFILTVEASGIAVATMLALEYDGIPVVFAKKSKPNTMIEDVFSAKAKSFTKGTESNLSVSKKHLISGQKVLIVDDFLAHGQAGLALIEISKEAGLDIVGFGAVIEKEYQGGSKLIKQTGVNLQSLAIIEKIEDKQIYFK